MGMYDTVYAELDCPFCGKQYRHAPLTWQQAEQEIQQNKRWQAEMRQKALQGEANPLNLQEFWARQDSFDDVDAWIAQLDAPEHIEAYRTRRHLGLAAIQTKAFDCSMREFYVGDEVPLYSGHYYIPEDFKCDGCSTADENIYVKIWLEIENRRLKVVLVRDPEIGEPAREIIKAQTTQALPPNPHPPLFFREAGIQAQARYDETAGVYHGEVTYLTEHYTFDGRDEEELRLYFELFVEGYLYQLGKNWQDRQSLHEHLRTICHHLPSDFEPYGDRERDGPDCSCGCRHFLKLPGKLGMDWAYVQMPPVRVRDC